MVDWEIKRDLKNEDLIDRKSMEAVLIAEQFECNALWHLMWKSTAIGLLTAADKVYNAYSDANKREMARYNWNYNGGILKGQELQGFLDTAYLFPIYLLLLGYAIENLLKGILYSKCPELLDETDKGLKLNLQKLNQSLKGHELTLLYKEAAKLTDLAALDTETKDILAT